MINPSEHQVFMEMVADYVNGHLNSIDTERMEIALEQDKALAQEIAFQTRLQSALRDPALNQVPQDSAQPGFASIKDQLHPRVGLRPTRLFDWCADLMADGSWTKVAMPIAAGFLMFGILLALPQSPDKDFETLTDPRASVGLVQVIGNVGTDDAVLHELLNEYGIEAVVWHSELNAVDVAIPAELNALELQEKLASDDRVRFVRILEND